MIVEKTDRNVILKLNDGVHFTISSALVYIWNIPKENNPDLAGWFWRMSLDWCEVLSTSDLQDGLIFMSDYSFAGK